MVEALKLVDLPLKALGESFLGYQSGLLVTVGAIFTRDVIIGAAVSGTGDTSVAFDKILDGFTVLKSLRTAF